MEPLERIQQAGRSLLVYVFSLMKTGEIHDLNNEAWDLPIEKLQAALNTLLELERHSITMVVAEGVAQVNSHALWLDSGTAAQAQELEGWLARREAGGIVFSEQPKAEHIRKFFHHFARFRAPEECENQFAALIEILESAQLQGLRLAPQPLRLEGVGKGVRGVASLWYYAKGAAGMAEVLTQVPVQVKAARRIAQEIVDACGVEQDLFIGLVLLAREDQPFRRAMDVGVFIAGISRGLGLSAVECAELTTAALLHNSGYAYDNPQPKEFRIPEVVSSMVLRQLLEGSELGSSLMQRLCVAVEHQMVLDAGGPPYLIKPPLPSPLAQLIALINFYLDEIRQRDRSPLQVALQLLREPPLRVDPDLIKIFIATVGLLPVGSVVELQNGDLGVVADIEQLRGRNLYNREEPPLMKPRIITVERMRNARGAVIPERRARVELGEDEEGREWKVVKVLKREGLRDLLLRALIRRPFTVVAQMGLR